MSNGVPTQEEFDYIEELVSRYYQNKTTLKKRKKFSMTLNELDRYIPRITEIVSPGQFRGFLIKKALKTKKNGILNVNEKGLKVNLRSA